MYWDNIILSRNNNLINVHLLVCFTLFSVFVLQQIAYANIIFFMLIAETYWQLVEFPEVRLASASVAASFTSPLSELHSLIRGCRPSVEI